MYQTNYLIQDAKEDSVDKATNDVESEPAPKKIKISEDKPIGYAPEEDLIKLRPQVINTDFCIAKRQKYVYYTYTSRGVALFLPSSGMNRTKG